MLNSTPRSARHQRQRVGRIQSRCDSDSFFNLLTSDGLLDSVEARLPAHRERLFPPTETLSMFLAQVLSADRSCQNIVNRCALNRSASALPVCSTFTGGYCRARQRLPLDLIQPLCQEIGRRVDAQTPESWRWRQRRVKIVDGTTLTMPDTPSNQRAFAQSPLQKPGLGFPICRLVGITSLASGVLLNAAIGCCHGKGSDEQALLRTIQQTFTRGDIVLGDAFYATYFFIAHMRQRGVDVLMEQHGSRRLSTDFRRGSRLGTKDHLIEIFKPKKCPHWMSRAQYDTEPDSLIVREFKANKKNMITTMTNPSVSSKADLATLYKSRWQIELDIRHIKTTLGMNVLSCKSPDMVIKEIWVHLLAYNLIRLLMARSAQQFELIPRQMSFKHTLQLWLVASHMNAFENPSSAPELLLLISQRRTGQRADRMEPRAVKRRPKSYPLLMKPRVIMKAALALNGHPKRLK